jgi:hypothetical protein
MTGTVPFQYYDPSTGIFATTAVAYFYDECDDGTNYHISNISYSLPFASKDHTFFMILKNFIVTDLMTRTGKDTIKINYDASCKARVMYQISKGSPQYNACLGAGSTRGTEAGYFNAYFSWDALCDQDPTTTTIDGMCCKVSYTLSDHISGNPGAVAVDPFTGIKYVHYDNNARINAKYELDNPNQNCSSSSLTDHFTGGFNHFEPCLQTLIQSGTPIFIGSCEENCGGDYKSVETKYNKDNKDINPFILYKELAFDNQHLVKLVNIYNMQGRLVKSWDMNSPSLNLNDFTKGNYIINATKINGKTESFKINIDK